MALNFNVKPYNDDYDPSKKFYRILFRPSVAVQARELTQLQTILQEQIARFGDHMFQHGSKVNGGDLVFDPKTAYVKIKPTYGLLNNTPIPVNLSLLDKATIVGSANGLKAQILYIIPAANGDDPTLYVKYLNGGLDGTSSVFTEDELLSIDGTPNVLASVSSTNATGLAATAQIGSGVYYIHGFFVSVDQQYLVLEKYNSTVSYRLGLEVRESIVAPEDDPSLTSNAQGANNYAGPGAHRYKIELVLTKRPIGDYLSDANFVELSRIVNSQIQTLTTKTVYSEIAKEFARRMDDTNGDFAVRPFGIDIREHLDTSFVTTGVVVAASNETQDIDGNVIDPATITLAATASGVTGSYVGFVVYINDGAGAGQSRIITAYDGPMRKAKLDMDWEPNKKPTTISKYTITNAAKINRGVYPPDPFGVGSESKLAVGVEAGKAYVKGFEYETRVTNFVDLDKARDTNVTKNAVVPAYYGNYILVKNLSNIPIPAASANKDYLLLHFGADKANGTNFDVASQSIGTARVRAIEFCQGSNAGASDAVFKVYLFDLQMKVANFNQVRSIHILNDPTTNNCGNGLGVYADVVAEMIVSSVNGLGFTPGAIITGPSGIGTEKIVSWDDVSGIMLTEPTAGTQVLQTGLITAPSNTQGTLAARTELFDSQMSMLLYPLSQQMIATLKPGGVSETTYTVRKMFELSLTPDNNYVAVSTPEEPFAPFTPTDYLAVVVAGTGVGTFINLENLIAPGSFGGSPAHTTLTFAVPGFTNQTIKLMTTVYRSAVSGKSKSLELGGIIDYAVPTNVMSLGQADIYKVVKIVDSNDPNVAGDVNNPAHTDITSRYQIDNGQRDTYYDIGLVKLKAGAPAPVGRVQIAFQYFSHTGSGDFFSVDSYATAVDYKNIPNYTSPSGVIVPLRDVMDFRPTKANSGANFTNTTFTDAVKPNDVVRASFSYYLKRIDKLYLDSTGTFRIIKGTSSLKPLPPSSPSDGMLLYTLTLGAYTVGPTDVSFKLEDNRRYTMRDIGKLEKRIENLEYYTSLNLLEKETASLTIKDTATGLDRFKQGFIVDNFKGHGVGDVFDADYECSVDRSLGELRPIFLQDNVGLDLNDKSTGYVKKGDVIMLPYTEEQAISQPFATRIVNINPYAVFGWQGTVSLDPPSDEWKDTVQRPDLVANDDTAFDAVRFANRPAGTIWNDWTTDWVGEKVDKTIINPAGGGATWRDDARNDTSTGAWRNPANWHTGGRIIATGQYFSNGLAGDAEWHGTEATVEIDATITSTRTTQQSRTGTTTTVIPNVVRVEVNDRVIATEMVPFIRTRIVHFIGRRLKPNTRFYPFFDGTNISKYCQPTLVAGLTAAPLVAGTWNDPLFSNAVGTVTGDFNIPNDSTLRFRTGSRTFRLTSDPSNLDTAESWGDASYSAKGILETKQKSIISIREAQVVTQQVSETRQLTDTTTKQETIQKKVWIDPLAETFMVQKKGGMFITKIEVFFATRDEVLPVTLQVREVVNGYPGQKVLPFGEVTLYPSGQDSTSIIQTSTDATLGTRFEFPTPVYLADGEEYCFVLLANSTEYTVFSALMGEKAIQSTNIVSRQPYNGVMFKSQNASTWTAEQNEDIKFNIYRAVFSPSAKANIYLTNKDVEPKVLGTLPFTTMTGSNLVRVQHDDHMMPISDTKTSTVLISNVAPGVYNGIDASRLNGEHTLSHVDLDSYTIEVSGPVGNIVGGRVGPDGVVATQNRQYDSLHSVIGQMVLPGTAIDWAIKTTTGKSPDNNAKAIQSPYNRVQLVPGLDYAPIAVNETVDFPVPMMIANTMNEDYAFAGLAAFERKSLAFLAVMSTTQDNLSPLIDSKRMSVITVSNRLDDPTFANRTIEVMDNGAWVESDGTHRLSFAYDALTDSNTITAQDGNLDFSVFRAGHYIMFPAATGSNARGFDAPALILKSEGNVLTVETTPNFANVVNETGVKITQFDRFISERGFRNCSTSSRYLTRRFTIKDKANSLRVYVTANKPAGSFVDLYYRILRADTNDVFDQQIYTQLQLDDTVDTGDSASTNDLKELVYTANQIGDFTAVAVKIVMRGGNSAAVPKLKDLRVIALAT